MTPIERDLLADGFELRETHISQVFLGDGVVYKLKKPVKLGFLDFSRLELRKHYCEREVALNQRLAPSVYRGVVPICKHADRVHRVGGPGEIVEWAVEMRRLPERDAADRRLAEGRLGRTELELIAERLARFHEHAQNDAATAAFGEPATIAANVSENFEQTREAAARVLGHARLDALEHWQHGFLREHAPELEARIAAGRIRDGHGDLRLEHCYIDDAGEVAIIDCIEFNERFRYGDVCADVAFLAMDLEWNGHHDLSEAFLSYYARAARDYDLYALVDFYESYRAYVRGKVSSMLADDSGIAYEVKARALTEARKYYLLAEACTREPLSKPMLIAIGGMIASGKSTLASELALGLEAVVIDADRTRKELVGVAPRTPLPDSAFSGSYDAETTEHVYSELRRRARVVLASQRRVVLDASFRARAERERVRELAGDLRVPFLFVECVAPLELVRERLAARARTRSISDGRLELLDAFVAAYEPVTELAPESHLRVDSARPVSESTARIRERIAQ